MDDKPMKPGNVTWVQCRCGGWFHVHPRLPASGVALHCPHCQRQFARGEWARIESPQ